jgi:hypothetical protein
LIEYFDRPYYWLSPAAWHSICQVLWLEAQPASCSNGPRESYFSFDETAISLGLYLYIDFPTCLDRPIESQTKILLDLARSVLYSKSCAQTIDENCTATVVRE